MITGIDADLNASTEVDLFRIKIWDKDSNDDVVYDNQMDSDDDSDQATSIGGGATDGSGSGPPKVFGQ